MKPTLLLSVLFSLQALALTACTQRDLAETSMSWPEPTLLADDDDDPTAPDDPDDPSDVDPDFIAHQAPRLRMPEPQLAKLLADTGFPKRQIPRLVCTAKFESHLDPNATNLNANGTRDTGLFQINDIWLGPCGLTRDALLDPAVNAKCALQVWKKQGLTAWTGFKKRRRTCLSYRV